MGIESTMSMAEKVELRSKQMARMKSMFLFIFKFIEVNNFYCLKIAINNFWKLKE